MLAISIVAQAGPAEGTSHLADMKGLRVHYESYGDGKVALVFIHGWTCDLTFWREQAPVYTSHRSLLVDLPGHGESDMPMIPYPMELFARGVEAAMRDAGVDTAVLIGHSLGGPIALSFLRLFPEKVKAVVLVDAYVSPPLKTPPDRAALEAAYRKRAVKLQGAAGRNSFASQIENMFSDHTPPDLRRDIRVKMLATPEHVRVAAVSTPPLLGPMKPGTVFGIPVLGIQAAAPGLDDRTKAMKTLFPKLRVEKWDGAGHFLMMEDPQRFNQTLERFLDALP